ncbi:MAG: flagellar basal body rod protein FlgB [Planctomycetota bacterium]
MFDGTGIDPAIVDGVRMSKTNNIMDFLNAGIRAESLRQQAIANNTANMKTPGYRRFDVEFGQLLAKELQSQDEVELNNIEPKLYQPKETPVDSNGNDVNLEAEIGEMIKNTLRHKTYIRLLNKKYNQIERAMNTG